MLDSYQEWVFILTLEGIWLFFFFFFGGIGYEMDGLSFECLGFQCLGEWGFLGHRWEELVFKLGIWGLSVLMSREEEEWVWFECFSVWRRRMSLV